MHYADPGQLQDDIKSSRVTSGLEITLGVNVSQTRQKVLAGNPIMGEGQVSVVHRVVSELGPNISDLYTREGPVIFKTAYGYKERMYIVAVPINQHLGEYNCVGCGPSQATRPELVGSDSWSMDDPFICLEVQSSCGF